MTHGALSLVLLMGSVNAACFHAPPPPVTAPTSTGSANAPAQVWSSRAGRRFTGELTLDQGTLYGGGVDRKVYAVDVESGAVKWSSRLIGIVAGGVLVSGDTVYAASTRPEGRVNALDRSNGQRFWRVNVGFVSVPLTLVDRVLLVANQRGELLGLDPKTGARHWRRHTGVAFIAPIPLDSGEVLLATPDTLFRIATGDGAVRRRVRAPGPVVSPWIRTRDALVAGTADSLVLAIDPDSLTTRWKVRLDAPVMDSPAVAGDTVYAATRRGTLYRVLPGTPARAERIVELDWPITAPVTIVHGLILLGGADGTIRALEPNGTERWRITLWRPIELGPVPLDDGMVVVGGKGDLHRYRR
ncbi:MAG TPA: PQQ-binding-like beta-propeller repeat protein [Gemmatimonadales bacterium]|nr:PQQ-binding-like beta-propeller repeat protein [Gemmatimonadales bacterium]